MWKKMLVKALLGLVVVLVLGRLLAMFSSPKVEPGIVNGKLAVSPSSPNCVNSQSDRNDSSYIAPLRASLGDEKPIRNLALLVDGLPRTKLIVQQEDYLYFQFRSLLFGFVDDVEFVKDRRLNVIHVRSASRMGYSDMGANRRRVEKIRELWSER